MRFLPAHFGLCSAVIQEDDADSVSGRLLSNIMGFTATSFDSIPSTFTTDSFSSAGPNSKL